MRPAGGHSHRPRDGIDSCARRSRAHGSSLAPRLPLSDSGGSRMFLTRDLLDYIAVCILIETLVREGLFPW